MSVKVPPISTPKRYPLIPLPLPGGFAQCFRRRLIQFCVIVHDHAVFSFRVGLRELLLANIFRDGFRIAFQRTP